MTKTKTIILLTLALLTLSCNQEAKRNQQLKDLLIGEWERCKEEPKWFGDIQPPPPPPGFNKTMGIEFFQDSVEFFNGFFQADIDSITGKHIAKYCGNRVPYFIKQDSIIIKNVFDYPMQFEWKFVSLLNDTLTFALDDSTTIKFKRLEYNIDTIPDFDQIIYSSSGCYGRCPIIDISIDKNNHIFFQGEGYVKKLGFFEGQLDNNMKKYIFDKFKKANPLQLEKEYAVGHTDDQNITTTYIKDGKIIKTISDYGGVGVNELMWAYVPIANLYNTVILNRIIDDEPLYPKYHYYTFEKGRLILPLEKSESFYLWTELKKSQITNQNFSPEYKITMTWNSYYIGPDANKRRHKYEPKKITTDGQFFKFEYKNAPSVTYDLGYNFIERNFEKSDFRNREEWEY